MTLVLLAASLALIVSFLAPFVIKPFLRKLNILDIPSARSSHSAPTLRGAGLATLAGFVSGCILLLVGGGRDLWPVAIVLGASAAAAAVGWAEDSCGIPIRYRLLWQILIGSVATGIAAGLAGSASWLIPVGALLIAGFINVANFMDGIDGISAFHGISIGCFYAFGGWLTGEIWMTAGSLVLAAVHLAFVPWNLGRTSFFLGDSGSYLLGAAVSVIGVAALCSGVPPLLIAGPVCIYLADATFTLLRRIKAGARWYESHRSHIYHQLEDLGMPHVLVASIVAGGSCLTGILGVLAVTSTFFESYYYIAAALVVVAVYLASPVLIGHFWSRARVLVVRGT